MDCESIRTEDELEERLSRPSPEVERAVGGLGGPLLVLGAGGKMGPSLARMAARAGADVVAVSRFGRPEVRAALAGHGVRTIVADLVDRAAVDALPDARAVLFLAGTKFGTSASPATTWALNAGVPWNVAQRYGGVPTVVFSSGNVYPLMAADGPGAGESVAPAPVGEYAQSVLARERIFEHASEARGTPVAILRLNYAVELRYGVLLDVARSVLEGRPIDLAMGALNCIWQGDANRMALAMLPLCAAPPHVLNVTGLEVLSLRALAERFGALLDRRPILTGREAPTALLADARAMGERLGPPEVGLDTAMRWIAAWLRAGGPTWDLPTHFDVRDGAF